MLVFVSDLHISDKSAGVHFLSPRSFDLAFERLARLAAKAEARHVRLVFLGDVFEMVRSTRWLEEAAATPWHHPADHARVAAVAEQVLDRIATADADNVTTFEILSGSLRDRYGFAVEPVRVYVPGNHDRVCNQFPTLRRRCAELLGMTAHNPPDQRPEPDAPLRHTYLDPAYRTFACHGHEWDALNFAGGPRPNGGGWWSHEDYMRVPIGEVVAAEVAARLPHTADERLRDGTSDAVRRRFIERLHAIDDVRPLAAIVPWLFDLSADVEETHRDELRNVLEGALDDSLLQVMRAFCALDAYAGWRRDHASWLPWARVNQVRAVAWLLRSFRLSRLRRALSWAEPLYRWLYEGDNATSAAARTFEHLDRAHARSAAVLYVLFGHTHRADQIPIEEVGAAARVYLNTGTWRTLARQGVAGRGFMSWKNLNFTVIYHPEHDPGSRAAEAGIPTFETWTGSVLDPRVDATGHLP